MATSVEPHSHDLRKALISRAKNVPIKSTLTKVATLLKVKKYLFTLLNKNLCIEADK